MSENVLKNVRIVHKHDTEENWLKATNFIPKQGELIIYDVDDKYNYERMKIGDGETLVNDLSFIDAYVDEKIAAIPQADWNQNDESAADYIKNRLCYTTDPVETVLFDGDVEFSIKNDTYGIVTEGLEDIIPNITEGQTYTVIFDGVTYETECWKFDYYDVYKILALGAETTAFNSYDKTDFSNYPFSIQVEKLSNVAMVMTNDIDNTSHYIKITANLSETVQLDEKYIAYKPGLKVEGNVYVIDEEEQNAKIGAEIFNDYENNIAVGLYSHASGYQTVASGGFSYTEGFNTTASGSCAHAEGINTTASGYLGSHAEGCETVASAYYAHAEGEKTVASGQGSHVEGVVTIAASYCQHVQGKYNIEDADSKYAHIVGNGADNNRHSNAHTLDWEGNAWFSGDVYVGSTSGTNKDEGSKKLATEEYVNTKANQTDLDTLENLVGTTSVQSQISSAIADLVDTAPDTLDTLGELATAIQENDSVIDTLDAAITNKQDKNMIVTITSTTADDGTKTYSADKTFEEIKNAINNGTNVYAKLASDTFNFLKLTNTNIWFNKYTPSSMLYQRIIITTNNSITYGSDFVVAKEYTYGGVKASAKSETDTIEAKIGEDGKLYVPEYPVTDAEISAESENPVQNKVVKEYVDAAITNKADKTEVEALKTQVTATSLILADAITGQKYEIQIQNGQLVSFPVEE